MWFHIKDGSDYGSLILNKKVEGQMHKYNVGTLPIYAGAGYLAPDGGTISYLIIREWKGSSSSRWNNAPMLWNYNQRIDRSI